jgi:beta-galactosidase
MLYINKSARLPVWAMEYSRDEALRKYWDEFSPPFHKDGDGPLHNGQDASAYNRNQDSHAIENVVRWFDYWEARPGTGKRVSAGGVNIVFSDSNTHHRGAENYRRSGETDAVRLPKDGFFAHQVMWDGWVEVEKPRTHIVGHWNYAPGTKKNVYVISSAEKVELFLNGKSLGFGEQTSRFLFTFKNVEWQPGEIKAFGLDKNGKKITEAVKKTAGQPFAVRLTPRVSPDGFRADGSDIALVDVEVVDKDGSRCPTALDLINFSLSGEAEWRGGIAQGTDNYILNKSLPVENGVNRVLLRSTRNAGKIVLRATAENLKAAEIVLNSKPFNAVDGLSLVMPFDNLPVNLSRGATPSGESFTPSRQFLEIANITAGSNQDKAKNSFDDNETTDWTSDGKAENAWIKYDLAQNAKINQVVLKLIGWRTQSYPVQISVDDRVVFTGNSPRSLGYVTFTFPPVSGKSVKIALVGNATNRDAFGNIIEIQGTPDKTSSAGKGGKNTLGIVEAEIYAPLKDGKNR